MLAELRIENLAVITHAELIFSPGLNVISGETGAGKTILAHAISLLLGSRADSGLIRPGADEASVEAIFTVPAGFFADLQEEIDVPGGQELIVRRRISRDGRSRAFLGGRATNLGVLGQITSRLMAFSAQHEQRRLMMASRQLDILDAFAGAGLLDLREEFSLLFDRRAEIRDRLEGLEQVSKAQAAEAELLNFQVAEIEAAMLEAGEDELLEAEAKRLVAAEELKESAGAAASALGSDISGEDGLMDQLSAIAKRLEGSAGIDPDLDAIAGRLTGCMLELEEIGRSALSYLDSAESDPVRLAEVHERLELISQLKRKYGGSLDGVINYVAQASERLALLTGESEAGPRLQKELEQIEQDMADIASRMTALRLKAASRLEKKVAAHLADLAFRQCAFEARVTPLEDFARTGCDAVEFLVSPNPGMPAAPVRDTASGGELSRIMLSIKSAISASGDSATLVFDEIDAGIGGETGLAVGAKLRSLAAASQVICITHLPQIACYGDSHFSVIKESGQDETSTRVCLLDEEGEIVAELCRMMGSRPSDKKAQAHARSLLENTRNATAGIIR